MKMIKIGSWNSRGLGSRRKEETLCDLIKQENPFILLIQETKFSTTNALKVG